MNQRRALRDFCNSPKATMKYPEFQGKCFCPDIASVMQPESHCIVSIITERPHADSCMITPRHSTEYSMPRTTAPYTIRSLRTVRTFLKVGSCSETMFHVLNRAHQQPMVPEENASMPFAGGIIQHGYQCGLLWGAALAAGVEAHRRYGDGARAEAAAALAAQKIVYSFHDRYGETNCYELIETDWNKSAQVLRYFIKGGTFRCFAMAASFAHMAFAELQEAFPDGDLPVPDRPVSCAAETVRRLGGSEQQCAIAAGLAGGIGFSGGACGALGAAIWALSVKIASDSDEKMDYKDPRALALIERFLECSDYRFECSDIVGREFTGIEDHSAYLHGGGCAGILDTLAAEVLEAVERKKINFPSSLH